ncbi:LemA family protein [Thermoflavifilum thermophilum]|uniref:LemA protein n=1 Tax=Thermoflavifilum thermophilum TaxID=1393122 RepID=A0A1I7NFE3_9BACT|nr:LemA family protein [Thermoflavifilum thermophilum]SFV33397.1 LemA protein [Thermoflavifilum thermophilum]
MKLKTGWIVLIIILLIILIGGCSLKNTYNKIVALDQDVKAKWGQVENQYQRRMDLIPNLVNTVKGAANFEQQTLTQVIQARASASQIKVDVNDLSPEKIRQFEQAQGQLTQALGRLMVVAERYPQLTATQNFRDLQAQLEGTENRIAVARMDFNNAVQQYNTLIKSFPMNLFAASFGFKEKGYFQAQQGAEKAPQVQF